MCVATVLSVPSEKESSNGYAEVVMKQPPKSDSEREYSKRICDILAQVIYYMM